MHFLCLNAELILNYKRPHPSKAIWRKRSQIMTDFLWKSLQPTASSLLCHDMSFHQHLSLSYAFGVKCGIKFALQPLSWEVLDRCVVSLWGLQGLKVLAPVIVCCGLSRGKCCNRVNGEERFCVESLVSDAVHSNPLWARYWGGTVRTSEEHIIWHNTDGKHIFKTLVHVHGRKHKTTLSVGNTETLEGDEEL